MTDYIVQYKQYHRENNNYSGNSLQPQAMHIQDLIIDTKSQTVLDYGCGKGHQYTKWNMHKDWGLMPELYDPAVPTHDVLPNKQFDGIISTDVMEHIPEEQIPEVFEYIFSHADKFVFLGISTQLAKALLPNGENAHCTVKPIEWWTNMVEKHAPKRVYTHIKTYGECNNYNILNDDLYFEML